MWNQIASGVMPVVTEAVITVVGVFISLLVKVAISYLNSKKEQLIQSIGIQKYKANYELAKSIFFQVEQQFKGQVNIAEEKKKMFDELLLKNIPYLTQDEIDHFRESVIGEINTQLKNSKLLETAKSQELHPKAK